MYPRELYAEAAWSRKYGRTAADALPKPRCGMSCANEPQLEQREGHEQGGDTGDIAPAQYQRLSRRGRREVYRHLRGLLGEPPMVGKRRELPTNVKIL